jgi:hypothetical protein
VIPVALVFAAITLVAPGVAKVDRARYAADIAATAPSLVIAKAMIATAVTESDLRPTIERCECPDGECDRDATGKIGAYGIYQLHWFHFGGHTAAEICGSNRLASELTARMFSGLVARLGGDVEEALRVFVGTSVKRTDPRVKRRLELFDRLMEVHNEV